MSPEAIDWHSDAQTDLWSCGITMYFMLGGYTPFRSDTADATHAAVRRGNFTFPPSEWGIISEAAKDLLRWLLTINKNQRCNAEQALSHVWIRQPPRTGDQLQRAVNNIRAKNAQRGP